MSAAISNSREEGGSGNGSSRELHGESESSAAVVDRDESNAEDKHNEDDEDEEDEEETEPILKYTRLTSSLNSVYRNGDSASCLTTAGDKLILGTHSGNVHVFSIPTLQPVRMYHAHSVSITAISVSPFSSALTVAEFRDAPEVPGQSSPAAKSLANLSSGSPKRTQKGAVAASPSNMIHIASASLDGHVCVCSLVDTKEVTLRNYARPVHAVALSPDYKNDHTYLSGGVVGSLILTTGGRVGVSSDANTNSTAAAASGWLGSIGLGSNTGRDTVLHSGEGSISNIKWSLSGNFVTWANEEGIRIMRSHMNLPSTLAESAWKSIGFVAKPNRRNWQDMAGVWKAHLEWIDEQSLESRDREEAANESVGRTTDPPGAVSPASKASSSKEVSKRPRKQKEKLLAGWGDTVWILEVHYESLSSESKAAALGKAEILQSLRFPDDVISGLSLYTPSLLLVLVYLKSSAPRNDDQPIATNNEATPRRGIPRKNNALPPDLRLVDLTSDSAVEDVSLTVGRFDTLSASSYHLSTIFVKPLASSAIKSAQKSAFDNLGELWDAGVNATRLPRLLSSSASALSGSSSGDKTGVSTMVSATGRPHRAPVSKESLSAITNPGLKIFIQSPYDSVLAIKRDITDRLSWLLEQRQYQEAWELIDVNPQAVPTSTSNASQADSRPTTPTGNNRSLKDFFSDTASESTNLNEPYQLAVEKEKRRIGGLWVQQLVESGKWATAGATAGQVLGDSQRWEHWILTFAQANKFDEITPHIPTQPLRPPLPSFVYEVILRHYIVHDRPRMKELLDQWHPGLFDISSVISAIDNTLEVGDVREDTTEDGIKGRDWQLLVAALAKLYLYDSRPTEAFRCFLHIRNADAAFELVREYQLFDAISSEVWQFVLLRTPRDAQSSPSVEELDKLSSEAIHILAFAAIKRVISPSTVIAQLEEEFPAARPYLFFYLRSLWLGDSATLDHDASTVASTSRPPSIRRGRFATGAANLVDENTSRSLLELHADLAVTLFAEYDRDLLSSLLKQSRAYTFEHADAVCESRNLIPELVHLLSTTGQSVRALHLIIDKLGDVRMAIDFAKEIDEPSLWDELLDYSMDKPPFVAGLLEEVGTTIDPVTLVRRIPAGLEVPGLKYGLTRIVQESEVMHSIAEGAARVMRGEVGGELERLQKGRLKGVVFDGVEDAAIGPVEAGAADEAGKDAATLQKTSAHCAICDTAYFPSAGALVAGDGPENKQDAEHLLGFPCGHIYHLTCVLDAVTTPANRAVVGKLQRDLSSLSEDKDPVGKVRQKVAHAQMIKTVLGEDQSCIACSKTVHIVEDNKK